MDGQSQETCTLDDPYWVFITVAEKLRCQNDILYQPLFSRGKHSDSEYSYCFFIKLSNIVGDNIPEIRS